MIELNDYCKLIEDICEKTIPGYVKPVRIAVTGKFAPGADRVQTLDVPKLTVTFKLGTKK